MQYVLKVASERDREKEAKNASPFACVYRVSSIGAKEWCCDAFQKEK